MKTGFWKLVAVLAILTLLVSSMATCAPTAEPTQAPPPAAGETAAPEPTAPPPEAAKKIVTFAWTQEPDSLNYPYSNMWFAQILAQLYNCWAWEFDDNNKPFPKLVTELPTMENGGLSEDGKVLTLKLRDDIVWSDGTPLTADDFVFTYEMIVNPANTVASMYPYDRLDSVEAPDERTVVMTFAEPLASWQSSLWKGILPKHVLGPVFEADGSIDEAEWNLAPSVSCGPFKFVEWESGSFMHFEKNPNYWLGEPMIDEIYLQFVPDDASQTAALLAGDADLGTFPPLSDVPTLQDGGLKIITQSGGYSEGLFFNFGERGSPGSRDLKVRQAIAQAIDREGITKDLLLGLTHPNETLWDPLAAYGYVSPDVVPWQYDPEAAKQLLEDAGWTDTDADGIRENADGEKLTLISGTTIREIRQDTQAVIQQQLKEVGIDIQLMSQDSDIFFGSYTDGAPCALGEVDIMEWSDLPADFPDPDHYYWLCSEIPTDEYPWGGNYFGCDEYLDGLFQNQITILDPEERAKVIQEITKYMHDNVYWLGLWDDPDYWIVGSRLTGVKFSGVTPFFNIMEWDVTQ